MTFVDAVVIPAAGAGSRFNELGKQYPKCCLPYQEGLAELWAVVLNRHFVGDFLELQQSFLELQSKLEKRKKKR